MEDQENKVEEQQPVEQPVQPVTVDKEKKNKYLTIILIIGLLLIIAASIFKFFIVGEDEPKEKKDKNSKENIGYVILQEEEVKEILSNYIINIDEDCKGELYEFFVKEKQEAKDLTKTHVALTIASYLYSKENPDKKEVLKVTEAQYKAAGTKLFGTAYNGEVPEDLRGEYIIKKTAGDDVEISQGITNAVCRVYLTHFKVSTNRLDDDVLTVNLKTVFSVAMDEDTVIHHRDVETKHTIGVGYIGKVDYENYYPKGDSYRMTFKKFDNTYIFEKVELVK